MKKLLITGAGSYVGVSVAQYLSRWPEQYSVVTVDMIGEGWKTADFSGFDAVLHVAGIVHQKDSKNDPAQKELYERVNTRLAIETAQKAKAEGVKQFLFMSSASVYGLSAPVGKTVMITKDTPLAATDNYGLSKAKAEEGLKPLADRNFHLAILRPPMIYGKASKGNYPLLAPYVENQRSMLYIENLCELVRLLMEDEAEGLFCPQDEAYVNTSDMVNLIAHVHGKNILMVRGFTWALRLLRHMTGIADKAFGSLCYDRQLSAYPKNYCVKDFHESILETET